jgi:hypothetical protein
VPELSKQGRAAGAYKSAAGLANAQAQHYKPGDLGHRCPCGNLMPTALADAGIKIHPTCGREFQGMLARLGRATARKRAG